MKVSASESEQLLVRRIKDLRIQLGDDLGRDGLRARVMPRIQEELVIKRVQLNGILVETFRRVRR